MLSEQKISSRNLQSIKDFKKQNQRIRWRKEKIPGPPIFISKTYKILENNDYEDVISWNEEGTNFIIIDVEKFQKEVLPVHFRHRNFSSFVRQLNMYDFHKIRNDSNKSIFQHKQFRRYHRQSLRNIKRKGCNGKKNQQGQQNMSISEHEEMLDYIQETPRKQQKYHVTVESIERMGQDSPMASIRVIHLPVSPSPQKKRKMDEFISSLPQIMKTEQEIQQKITQLKNDPNYDCLNTKSDIRKLISKIRRKLPKKENYQDLEELSIEEEIIVDKMIDKQYEFAHEGLMNPTLAVLSTEKYLPRSINFISSLNFCDDSEQLFYQKLY